MGSSRVQTMAHGHGWINVLDQDCAWTACYSGCQRQVQWWVVLIKYKQWCLLNLSVFKHENNVIILQYCMERQRHLYVNWRPPWVCVFCIVWKCLCCLWTSMYFFKSIWWHKFLNYDAKVTQGKKKKAKARNGVCY